MWQEALECKTPDVCIFMLGTNDTHKELYNDTDFLEAFKTDYREILDLLSAKYQRLIVMIPPPCLNDNEDHRCDVLQQWAHLIPELADGLEVEIINLFEAFGAEAPLQDYFIDNVHLNETGYKVIAEALRDILQD